MLHGYNVNVDVFDGSFRQSGKADSYTLIEKDKAQKRMHKFFIEDYEEEESFYLDAQKIIDTCFPIEKYHLFVSHSFSDVNIANGLAYECSLVGINAFVDSNVWLYSNDLLKLLDNKYSKGEKGNCDYDKRNISTSHVHMILSASLNRMIDECECFMFLNTSNSIDDTVKSSGTFSPWIMSELLTSRIVRKKIHEYRPETSREIVAGIEKLEESLSVRYPVDFSHLREVNANNLAQKISFLRNRGDEDPFESLDYLYNNL